jgi:hypothetical protein
VGKLDASRQPPPGETGPRELLRLAAERAGRLLVVLDQFEQLFVAQESNARRFEAFVALLRSLGRDPIPGLNVLITLRGDYVGFLQELDIATITLNENLRIIDAFRPPAARNFLARAGLQVDADYLGRAVDELAGLEKTEGLIRPITLNMLGLALSHRASSDASTLPGVEQILTDYCKACLARPAIGHHAPSILRPMISRFETIQPRSVPYLARRAGLRPGVVRGVLLNLGNDGLVRRVDATEDLWEVAHDFVAHLLAGLLDRFQSLKIGGVIAAAALLMIGLTLPLRSLIFAPPTQDDPSNGPDIVFPVGKYIDPAQLPGGLLDQDALKLVGVRAAIEEVGEGYPVKVGLISTGFTDTGVGPHGESLDERTSTRISFVKEASRDSLGLGTEQVSLIGVIAPKAQIVALKVTDIRGSASDSDILKAIDYAIRDGVKVLILPLAAPRSPGEQPSKVMSVVFERARKKDVLVFASAGNSAHAWLDHPANCPPAIAVSATTLRGHPRTTSKFP